MKYWFISGLKDAYRAKGLLWANVLVLSGICLPILLLLGLKRGLVAQFREDINKSPTARLISTYATSGKWEFTVENTEQLKSEISNGLTDDSTEAVSLIVPEIPSLVTMSYRGSTSVTLTPTLPGDPFLAFHGADVLAEDDRGVVIATTTASAIGLPVSEGEDGRFSGPPDAAVTVELSNSFGQKQEVKMPVRGIWNPAGSTAKAGKASLTFLNWVEDFKKGRSVAELGLSGADGPPEPFYDGYLAFSRQPFNESDLRTFRRRGLTPVALEESNLPRGDEIRHLFGLLKEDHDLLVHWVRATKGEDTGTNLVNLSAVKVEDISEVDDVVIPWVRPRSVDLNNASCLLVSSTVRARWLRSHFNDYAAFRETDLEEGTVGWGNNPELPAKATLALPPDVSLEIQANRSPAANSPQPGVLFVSSTLASHIARFTEGRIQYDEVTKSFVPGNSENAYTKASVFVSDIRYVPTVDEKLKEMGFGTISSRTRVEEMMNHVRSLDLLILVIFSSVFLFGVFTLLFLFNDVTNRKRGTVGIMRLLGAEFPQIFAFLFVRSVLVAGVATIGSFLAGILISQLLAYLSVECIISLGDLKVIAAGSFLCCAVGVALPAIWTIRRLEPVEAIAKSTVH